MKTIWIDGRPLILIKLHKNKMATVSDGHRNFTAHWDDIDLTHYCYACGEKAERSVCRRCEVKEMDRMENKT